MNDLIFSKITPLVITFNEEANIRRCLDSLRWAQRIVVIDSGSTDETLDMVRSYSQAAIFHRPFDDFASQCNFGLERIETPWVLSLDADYVLTSEVVSEFQKLREESFSAYESAFVYCIYGQPLRGTLYPPRCVLYRRMAAHYRNEGHGHRVVINGRVGRLRSHIHHDDRKPLSRWVASQQRYAAREAEYLLASDPGQLRRVDRIRLMGWPAPIAVFFYTLLWKGILLDGWRGWFYVLQRTLAEIMIALEVIDRRLERCSQETKARE